MELKINWHGIAKLNDEHIDIEDAYQLLDTAQVTQTAVDESWSIYSFQRPEKADFEALMGRTQRMVNRWTADANTTSHSVWDRDAAREARAYLAVWRLRLETQQKTFAEWN